MAEISKEYAEALFALGIENAALNSDFRGFIRHRPSNGYAFGRLIEHAHVTGAYRHGVEFSNQQLEWQLIEEERRIKDAVGETLPAPDEFLEAENRRAAEREQLRKELQKINHKKLIQHNKKLKRKLKLLIVAYI